MGVSNMVRLLALFALLGIALTASAQPALVNCAPSTPCTLTGPANTGTGDPAYQAFGKLNSDVSAPYLSTATGIAPTAAGGTGTGSALTGLVRGGYYFTASEISGDCTTSGSNAITCTKTGGVALGTFATQNYATPPSIGGTAPAPGAFTTLVGSGVTVGGGLFSTGTAVTISGCGTAGTIRAGALAGTFVVGTGASTCTFVFTINGATGATAAHGWIANVDDVTAVIHCPNSGTISSTTTATVKCNSTVTTGDLITFSAIGF